ncbi:MAG: hypothetical protein JXR31_04455 [Prolixibacteraceae bacterium]|nr:hypothetical protein [Prolixibacteraceae bacterium]MBN2773475.1 hypothetical protein [Prolixibacteraceae bacterium]
MKEKEDNYANVKTSRGVFITGPDNIDRTIFFYPMNAGRNMEELIRTVKALKMSGPHVLIPANREPGDDILTRASHLDPSEEKDEIQKDYYNVGPIMWYKRFYNNKSE